MKFAYLLAIAFAALVFSTGLTDKQVEAQWGQPYYGGGYSSACSASQGYGDCSASQGYGNCAASSYGGGYGYQQPAYYQPRSYYQPAYYGRSMYQQSAYRQPYYQPGGFGLGFNAGIGFGW